jgi:hypothetical protein
MEAILKFNLDDPDDRTAHLRAIKSLDLSLALLDIKNELRSNVKHFPDSEPEEAYKAYSKIQDEVHDILSRYSIDLDDLVI